MRRGSANPREKEERKGKTTHLKLHRTSTPSHETLLPVNTHHPRPIPASLLVAHEPRLVEPRDERPDLQVELDGERRGGERGLAVEVGAEKAVAREEAGLKRGEESVMASGRRIKEGNAPCSP